MNKKLNRFHHDLSFENFKNKSYSKIDQNLHKLNKYS